MALRRLTIRIACADAFAAPVSMAPIEVVEGTFMPDTFAVVYASAPGTPSIATTSGIQLAVGQPLNVGPRTTKGAGFRLDEFYFANAAAGSNGFVNFVGIVEDVAPIAPIELQARPTMRPI